MSRRSDIITIVGGVATVAVTGALAPRAKEIHPYEQQVFRSVNTLPHGVLPPVFVVMQSGSLAASFVAAGAAKLAGRTASPSRSPPRASASWGTCKVIKNQIGRGRPAAHIDDITTRGPKETGLGFPSGHSAVVFALASLAAPHLPPGLQPVAWGIAVTTGVEQARMYVGAHLPLDIIGGAAVGKSATALARLVGGG